MCLFRLFKNLMSLVDPYALYICSCLGLIDGQFVSLLCEDKPPYPSIKFYCSLISFVMWNSLDPTPKPKIITLVLFYFVHEKVFVPPLNQAIFSFFEFGFVKMRWTTPKGTLSTHSNVLVLPYHHTLLHLTVWHL
jgi:hypothetical protein